MAIHRTRLKPKEEKVSDGKKIIHLQLSNGENHYFGSIAAIFEKFAPEDIGVSKSRLWSFGITPDKPYKNKFCTIFRGDIERKKGGRSR